MELFSLDSVILIIVTCNCLPFSGSRSIFRRHVSWQVLKIAFRGPQTWNFSGGGHPESPPTGLVPSALAIMRPRYKNSSFGPVYASAGNPPYRGLLAWFIHWPWGQSANEKRRKESGGLYMLLPFLSPLKQESDTCRGDHTVPDEF